MTLPFTAKTANKISKYPKPNISSNKTFGDILKNKDILNEINSPNFIQFINLMTEKYNESLALNLVIDFNNELKEIFVKIENKVLSTKHKSMFNNNYVSIHSITYSNIKILEKLGYIVKSDIQEDNDGLEHVYGYDVLW